MYLSVLRDNLILPFVVLLVVAGLHLSLKLSLIQFRYLFHGIKVLTGAMDQKGSKGKLTPFQAFTTGGGGGFGAGAFMGAFFAVTLYGYGILPWIWLSSVLNMPVQFVASTLTLRFRGARRDGNLDADPSVFILRGLRARWFSYLFSGLFLATSLVYGAAFISGILFIVIREFNMTPVTLSIFLIIFISLLTLGGVRRVGWISRRIVIAALFVFIPMFLSFQGAALPVALSHDLAYPTGWFDFFVQIFSRMLPEDSEAVKSLVFALGFYHILAESGNGKLAVAAGLVRTDFAAKQGIASMFYSVLAGLFFSTLTVYAMYVFRIHTFESSLVFLTQFGTNGGTIFLYLLTISFVLFLMASLSGWSLVGLQSARSAGGQPLAIGYQIAFVSTILVTGIAVQFNPDSMRQIFVAATIVATLTSIIVLMAVMVLWRFSLFELKKYLDERHVRYEISKDFFLFILVLLPQHLYSRLLGWISYIHLPRFIMLPFLRAFVRYFHIDVDEAEMALHEYPSLNRFFTRSLKEGARTVDRRKNSIVSPVDGTVSRFGEITEGRMIQAKGIDYTLSDLLESSRYRDRFEDGSYIVIYLSPRDYHRIHSPHEGKIIGYSYTPGKLFAVNRIAVSGVAGLFPKNERLTSFIETDSGLIALIKVGAVNVGKIRVNYDTIRTNRWIRFASRKTYKEPFPIDRGEEVGRFEMGSTVILLFEKGRMKFSPEIKNEKPLRFGDVIGTFLPSKKPVKRSPDKKPSGRSKKR